MAVIISSLQRDLRSTTAFSIGQCGPHLAVIPTATASAARLYEIIDHPHQMQSGPPNDSAPLTITGAIEFRSVSFTYSTRVDTPVLSDFSLDIQPGQTVAFVGPSGSGKSTIAALLERFYDPTEGDILIDGHKLNALDVGWLRRQIGTVGQEPVLFSGSLRWNVEMGLEDEELQGLTEGEKEERVVEACKIANAWEFVRNLPDGLDTVIGADGGKLSGGQKAC